ncbi:hypothetical protein SAMN05444004_12337 [Jannaschia faecimaris]|uniref:Uncharacterized protein n=2 Tax=Jannaschia faecimaris TaxID=1244108 RepID=A0A1H3U4H8_9RHOB|nr:hypothetical protein SAMN05444004_12337 [Jannaschia faecimaris]
MVLRQYSASATARSTFSGVGKVAMSVCIAIFLTLADSGASAQQPSDSCSRPAALEYKAFDAPMTFSWATNKGNMSTSAWIVAAGVIQPDTPDQFRNFLDREGVAGGQLVLHSPGGNLAAGLEMGRIIRSTGLTTHIGRTDRTFESYDTPCDTWFDSVRAGTCASSCAYAFLGGEVRFVDSPYYPTDGNLLGFHQFFGGNGDEAELITPEQAAGIRASTLSVAQAITGQIVMYAVEMGIDSRIVAFASSTPSDNLYYPTAAEIADLQIASGSGLAAWFMEPYNTGLVTAARPSRSDSMLEQITMFCLGAGREWMLITMEPRTPSYPNPDDLPLNAVEVMINGQLHVIPRRSLDVRYGDGSILIRAPMDGLTELIPGARRIEFSLDAARVMGNFREGNEPDETARRSIALAWRNCI